MKKIICLFLILASFFSSCKKDEGLRISEHFYLRNNNADMPVWVEGNATSQKFVVFLHGGPGAEIITDYNNTQFSELMEKHVAVVYWSQRKAGSSAGNVKQLSVSDYVDDLEKLILLLKHRYGNDIKLYLLGHSWGGALSTAFLTKNDNQKDISSFIDMAGMHNEHLNLKFLSKIKTIAQNQILLNNQTDAWSELLSKLNQQDTATVDGKMQINKLGHQAEELLENADTIKNPSFDAGKLYNLMFFGPLNMASTAGNNQAGVESNFIDEVLNLSYDKALDKITIPVLCIWGKYDLIVSHELGYDMYVKVKSQKKEILIIENTGHWSFKSHPVECSEKIIRFIND